MVVYFILTMIFFPLGILQAKSSLASGHISYKELLLPPGKDIIKLPLLDSSGKSEYVIILNKGKVYEDGKVLTHDNLLIDEFSILEWKKSIDDHPMLKSNNTNSDMIQTENINGNVAVIASSGSENYFHWLLQIIPRIKILQESKLSFKKLYFYNLNQNQLNMLKNIGIKESSIVNGKSHKMIIADRLLVPSIPFWPVKNKFMTSWIINDLKAKFLKTPNEKFKYPKKIFISRKKASSR